MIKKLVKWAGKIQKDHQSMNSEIWEYININNEVIDR